MPIEPAAPNFPRPESLARFFGMPPSARVALAEAAELLGTTASTLRAMLREEGAQPLRGTLPWTEAAAYLFDAWPRAQILDALGDDVAKVIPPDFQLTRVTWPLPIFVVRAMEHQAAAAWRNDPRVRRSVAVHPGYARGVADYVADLLYNEIDPATVEAFRHDRAFLRAFHYPIPD
ncbi:MAG TPA: hypothetical protein VEK57_29660 [Thermoanaerobaculia bacterium]|nr:hypothetical protein [Thermoanaerobaculia bacterium]